MLSQSECSELFGKVQQAAKSLGVADVEALIGAHCGALTRFANNTIHQNVAEQDRWLSVRVALDQRTARATTNRFDPDSIRAAVEQALMLARSAAPNPDLLPLAEPAAISTAERFDARNRGCDAEAPGASCRRSDPHCRELPAKPRLVFTPRGRA